MKRRGAAFLFALVGLAGCGVGSTSSTTPPLGRSLGFAAASVRAAPPPTGDPRPERGGAVPLGEAVAEQQPTPGSLASSAQVALLRYALAYTNWQASSLPAHERQLASLAISAARLAAEQIAISQSGAASLAADHVRNSGLVLAIAPGKGSARRQWVVVTNEQTTGTGPYAGLPSLPHVTLARTTRVGSGWAVSEWSPKS